MPKKIQKGCILPKVTLPELKGRNSLDSSVYQKTGKARTIVDSPQEKRGLKQHITGS